MADEPDTTDPRHHEDPRSTVRHDHRHYRSDWDVIGMGAAGIFVLVAIAVLLFEGPEIQFVSMKMLVAMILIVTAMIFAKLEQIRRAIMSHHGH